MSTIPPGWYDDGHGAQRWWDGTQWTAHAQPAGRVAVAVAPAEADGSAAAGGAYAPTGIDVHDGAYAPAGTDVPGGPYAPVGTYAPAAAVPQPRSKLWILFVALGVVVVGLILAAALLIPRLITDLAAAATAGPGTSVVEPDDEQSADAAPDAEDVEDAEPDVEPTVIDPATLTGDSAVAAAAVAEYDRAWREADCDAYFAVTTQAWRDALEIATCDVFAEQSAWFAEGSLNYQVALTDVYGDDEYIYVDTVETYDGLFDEDGNALETPEHVTLTLWYEFIPVDGQWVIDYIGQE